MKLPILTLLTFLFHPFFCHPSAAATQPNILVIFTDDHGWADLGMQGVDADIRTPNLDQFTRDGVLFKRGYVTAPQCTPSRAGLLSGRYQNRFGVENNGIALQQDVVTLPERLKAAGYITGISGKWHLDYEDQRKTQGPKNKVRADLAPHLQGFDEYFTGFMQNYSASHALEGTVFADAPHAVHDDRCRVVIQTDATLSFFRRREAEPNQPWFHYLAWMAPHVPLESPEPWFSQTPTHLPKVRRQALALIGAIDDGLGRIRAQLKAMGQEQNTLIFLIGDNGAPLGKVWDGSVNLPMRGQKGMLSEGGIRVPFVAAWPGKIPAGQTYDQPVISLDVAATAAALAGAPNVPAQPLDGVNLMPFLTGENKAAPHETLYWRWMSQAAVQEYPYKLIALGGQGNLLFDVTTPEGESLDRNLISQKPDIAARLEAKLRAWCTELQPPGMPPAIGDHHVQLFSEHGISVAATAQPQAKPAPAGSAQGWLCRNGTLTENDGILIVNSDADKAAFIARTQLQLAAPALVKLTLKSTATGPASVTWRVEGEKGFLPANVIDLEIKATDDWQTHEVKLPATGNIIHLRIQLPKGITQLNAIELHGATDVEGSNHPTNRRRNSRNTDDAE